MARALAYYVSAHGYGHAVRTADILRAVAAARPDLALHVVTAVDADVLASRLSPARATLHTRALDIGMVQHDSLRIDFAATLAALDALAARREELIVAEIRFLAAHDIGLVVADIPAVPLEAAHRAGLPAVAVGNFGWDFIYAAYAAGDARWQAHAESNARAYAATDLLLRLPFAEPMPAFKVREDLPLVASPGRARRDELAALTGADAAQTWILLSFTTLNWDRHALDRVAALAGYEFFTVPPLAWERPNLHAVPRQRFPFSDLAASVDVVVSKPGFGIVSDCVANRRPLIYSERRDFPEYAVLEAAIGRYLRHVRLEQRALYAGELGPALAAITSAPAPPETMAGGGAGVAAERLVGMLGA